MATSRVLNIPELLNEIFFASFPESGIPLRSLIQAPLNVSQVCKWWRSVALANPRLWSRLYLIQVIRRDPSSVLSVIPSWLARSDPVPFSLVLKIRGVTNPNSCAVWKARIGELLLQNSRRWELLDVNIFPFLMQIGHPDTGEEFTHLRKLVLNEHLWLPDRLGVGPTYRIQNTPKLEYLTLHGNGVSLKELIIDCKMSPSVKEITLCHMDLLLSLPHPTSVTNLVLDYVHILLEDFEKFPDSFPLLERFEVTHCDLAATRRSRERPESFVVLENLHVLIVHANGTEFPMKYITAPQLKSLSLLFNNVVGEILVYPGTIPFIARSNPHLEELKFKGLELECYGFNTFLEMVPNLRQLHIIDAPISDYMLKKFTPAPSESGTSSVLCPELETLICNYVAKDDPHEDGQQLISVSIDLKTICCLLTKRMGKLKNVGLPLTDAELQHIQETCLDQFPGLNLYKVDQTSNLWYSIPV